jgi:hypothetical protein
MRSIDTCNRGKSVAGLIITLVFLLVPLQLRAAATCQAGKTMCSGRCLDLSSAPRNCGACGRVCGPSQTCSNGVCSGTGSTSNNGKATSTCKVAGRVMCGSTCFNLSVNAKNCGQCGHACAVNQTCAAGVCSGNGLATGNSGTNSNGSVPTTCKVAGRVVCNGKCFDLNVNAKNCGMCGHACQGAQQCRAGVCSAPGGLQ